MGLFDRFKRLIACVILTAFIPSQAWAQGIIIPAGSALNLQTGQLTVPGNVLNAGTLTTTTGTINLNGNWTNSGTFGAGAGTVNFNAASGTQSLDSGGTSNAFYNLIHTTNSTISMTGHDIDINKNFTNTTATGGFLTNNFNMTVNGDWNNTSASTFTPGTDSVTLDGNDQQVLGSTTFYNLSKIMSSGGPYNLTFDSNGTQNVSKSLTLKGNNTQYLNIRSTTPATQAKLYLNLAGAQSIQYLDVKDSLAGAPASQQTLVDRNASPASPAQNNTNWDFNNATLTWTGGLSTEWNNVANWSPMVVPASGDTVIIPGIGTAANQPNLCPPTAVNPCPSSPLVLANLTLNANASLTLNGIGLTVSSIFTNSGTIILKGSEAVTLTQDPNKADNGTFDYIGTGNGVSNTLLASYDNLTIDDTNPSKDTYLSPANSNLSILGNLTITSGTFTAPVAAYTFNIGGNFINHGTFNNSNGTVTLNGANQSVLGTTTFYNFTKIISTAATLTFDHSGVQTFNNNLTLNGAIGQLLTINSDSAGHAASINLIPPATQSIKYVYVQDSNAGTSPGQTTLVGINSQQPASNANNTNWVFETLGINVPTASTIIGQTPVIIGVGPPSTSITIKGIVGGVSTVVAAVTTDVNGNFRVAVPSTTPLDISNSTTLTPYITSLPSSPGPVNTLAVETDNPSVAPHVTFNQVPIFTQINCNNPGSCINITNPSTPVNISGSNPTISGQGAANKPVTIEAITYQGINQDRVLTPVATGSTDANGNFTITVTTPLPSMTNYLSVTVGTQILATSSLLLQVSLTDPYGYVFNEFTNLLIQGAVVTLYNATTNQAATGVQSCNSAGVCTSANPFTTGVDGFYSFLAPPGQYYMKVSSPGYNYPSVETTYPAGRIINTGSKGETFTVGNSIFEIDQPLDANIMLLRITKTANKSEASVGDIVTYTINVQNLSAVNSVTNVELSDQIPPGFKYINNRVLLNNAPTAEPSGQRPLVFNIGTIPASMTDVLEYQLVIGSGVTMGTYRNKAIAKYVGGSGISNEAVSAVKIIPDPVFDLGSVIGKVFFDWNENGIQDPPYYDPVSHETIIEKPVPNVQIVMEDGTVITTDRDGKFNIPGLLPGRHLFRLDERTLPPGAYMTTDKTVIVDVTAGSFGKVNFGVNIDQAQVSGRDAVFFNEKIRLTQDRNRPVPRLNAALFDVSADAKPNTEELVVNNGILIHQAEFRIFTNYFPFICTWRLEIVDADTKKLIKHFEGTALNINDPIYWNGRDDEDQFINTAHNYSYVVTVMDQKGNHDETKEKALTIREIKDEEALRKENEVSKDIIKNRADRYRQWLSAQEAINNMEHQLIPIQGETIHLDRQGTDVKSIKVMKGDHLFTDIPLSQQYGLTPDELMAGGFSTADEKDNLEIILPNGDYSLDVISAKSSDNNTAAITEATIPEASSSGPSRTIPTSPGALEHYSRPLKVGDDYVMFVALGDAQAGYNIDRGNIEPIQDSTQLPGFYKQGKGAFYLKGQILGKYLITSSYDSDRAQKALFRQLDPNVYYPVYGDQSSINYDAADTQGALYLKVEWDKSSAILGNYAVDFNDTEFAAFSRSYYGGKIDYQSVSSNPYGDARTKIVVYHAQVQQLPSHNEFLATGGSLYFLKYRNVIQGSDTVTIQVRDETTGLVLASQTMTNGADYELDNSQGRILFWQPVAMLAQSESIISNSLINGNPIYVVVDYQYAASGLQTQSSQGARVAQAIGDNLVVGSTYVQDNQSGQNYTLQGTDATLHVNKDDTIKAEYAQTTSSESGSYVSTDGGITFNSLVSANTVSGKAYGIKGDARLFDNIGLKSYYKWIGNDFATPVTSSQQGKEMMGMSLTFDMTPETRLTASEDIQRLLAGGNLQTSAQVGASETDTTMVQVVHTAERLTLTGQFQLTEVKSVVDGITSTTNQRGATIGGQAQYDLTDRVKITLGQQLDVINKANNTTTIGISDRFTDHLTARGQETFGQQGRATDIGLTNKVSDRIALTTDYTLTNLYSGEVDKTAAVGIENKVNNNLMTTGSVSLTSSSTGSTTTSASVGAKAKTSDTTSLDMALGKSQSSSGAQSTSVSLNGTAQVDQNTSVTATGQISNGTTVTDAIGVGTTGVTTTSLGVTATKKIDSSTDSNASVNVSDDTSGNKSTTVGFGNDSKLNQELQAVTSNSFTFSPGNGSTDQSKYGLVRNQNGQNLEADYTRQLANQPSNISQSNIYGLSGDVNDKLALNGSIERGKVQNLDATQTERTDFTFGSGYVLKDTETAVERLKNSVKFELRLDKGKGMDSYRQFVFYDALEGKITDNLSANIKLDYSKTTDTTTGAKTERHQEIILGAAYRPVNFDNLNFIAEYSYSDGYGGGLQQADALNTDVLTTKTQVISGEGVYDINDNWQLAEKIALRVTSEQVTGFDFTQTHTWLVIHRLNYKIDRNWTISGEYRDLTQVEAKDNKQGILLEATHELNNNTELGIGWNFTQYNDDLTNLSYTAQGPFVRMTGKFYDRTPEEKARDRARWLDMRINDWAWVLIQKELARKDSKIVRELNRLFILAKEARKAGRLEESHQIYKDIIAAGQMMYDEASEYIRGRITFEEQMQKMDKSAQDYFRGGEYVKARKIWEKVVEDASKGVVK